MRCCEAQRESKKVKGTGVKALTFAVLLLPFALLSACAQWSQRPEPVLRQATAEELIALLREREAAIRTMKGLFRVQVQGPGVPIAQRVEGAMYYRRADGLRLQGFNRVGGELFEFVLGSDFYRLRLPAGQLFTGHPAELERIGVLARPFKLSALAMSGVLGTIPVSADQRVTLIEDGDRYRLDVYAPEGPGSGQRTPARRIWFDRQRLQVVQEELLSSSGEVEATAQFDDFRPVRPASDCGMSSRTPEGADGVLLKPFRITAQDGRGRGIIFVTFQELVPNAMLSASELAGLNGSREGSHEAACG